jgi:uncharacterized protein
VIRHRAIIAESGAGRSRPGRPRDPGAAQGRGGDGAPAPAAPRGFWYGGAGSSDASSGRQGPPAPTAPATREGPPLRIYVDADACPVKQEVFKVAQRHGLGVTLVAASWMRIPDRPDVTLKVVDQGFDAADDWIAEHVTSDDLVITGDVPLAARCIGKGAYVLGPAGRPFTESNIGDALATRNLLSDMRSAGLESGGPAQFSPQDRSRFLQELHRAIEALRRERG